MRILVLFCWQIFLLSVTSTISQDLLMIASKENKRYDCVAYDQRSVTNIGQCFGTCLYHQNSLSMNVFKNATNQYQCFFCKTKHKGNLDALSDAEGFRYYEKSIKFVNNKEFYDFRSIGVKTSCLDWFQSGLTENGLYQIMVHSGTVLEVFCDMKTDGGGWIKFQNRFDGSVVFSGKLWNDFRNGFGNLSSEFWLGNEYVHHLTKSGNHELYIEATDFDNVTNFAKYSNFRLENEDMKYALQYEACIDGTCDTDNLAYHKGKQFTTPDSDNDQNSNGNCALQFEQGWWHNHCYRLAFNGPYHHNSIPGIVWHHFRGYTYHFKKSKMMIR